MEEASSHGTAHDPESRNMPGVDWPELGLDPLRATLVLGGARSGKSRLAEDLARASGRPRRYLATAQAGDSEMRDRIARHRADRGPDWTTIEDMFDLVGAITDAGRPGDVLLIDCLTLWLSNLTFGERVIATEQAQLCAALAKTVGPVVLVSNEIGLGLVPETPLGRTFRDAQGRLNQAVAATVPQVIFVAAGLPLVLKSARAKGSRP